MAPTDPAVLAGDAGRVSQPGFTKSNIGKNPEPVENNLRAQLPYTNIRILRTMAFESPLSWALKPEYTRILIFA